MLPMATTKKAKQTPKRPLFTRKKRAAKKALTKSASGSAEAPPADGEKQTKTAFVLSFSPDTPAKEVVAKGAEGGIQLSEKGVHKTRYLARSKGSKGARTPAKKAPTKAPAKVAKVPKKGKRGRGDGRGSAFIRSMPPEMRASEVVAAAAKEGISITAGLVYSVRGAAKKGGAKAGGQATGKRRGRPPKAARPTAKIGTGGSDRERQLLALALDLGLARSVELIEDLKAKIGSLI